MNVSEEVRVRGFAVAGIVCLALIFLLRSLDPTEFVKRIIPPLVLLFVFLWLFGLYCTHRYWKDFRQDEVRRGGSEETARAKWHKLHQPPG
jgi:energy-coupling factor transporter transmembrane protein EcfT